ncbi:MAG: class I SAM-dependent methyltransferase [Pseudomonadota bacterium]
MPDDDELNGLIDFTDGSTAYRLRRGAAQSHPLTKATGLLRSPDLTIVDATAGLGRDAFLIASLGFEVTLIERSTRVYDILSQAMQAARETNAELSAIVDRMTLLSGDAQDLLPDLNADIVMVDPMHPERTSSALVKQEMRTLRDIVGSDPDSMALVETALATARKRVVLKWPLRAALPDELRRPTFTLSGKTVRYDVFEVAGDTRTI